MQTSTDICPNIHQKHVHVPCGGDGGTPNFSSLTMQKVDLCQEHRFHDLT